jgi:hypothetical protein
MLTSIARYRILADARLTLFPVSFCLPIRIPAACWRQAPRATMRLLFRSETGKFNLTKDLVGDDPIPPYAILSHTWGPDDEEVTFEDMINGTGEKKLGYEKIRFCGEQAREDSL